MVAVPWGKRPFFFGAPSARAFGAGLRPGLRPPLAITYATIAARASLCLNSSLFPCVWALNFFVRAQFFCCCFVSALESALSLARCDGELLARHLGSMAVRPASARERCFSCSSPPRLHHYRAAAAASRHAAPPAPRRDQARRRPCHTASSTAASPGPARPPATSRTGRATRPQGADCRFAEPHARSSCPLV